MAVSQVCLRDMQRRSDRSESQVLAL